MKKIIALLLALVLAVSCFVACDTTKPEDTKDTTPKTTEGNKDTTPDTTEPAVEDLFDGKHEIVEITYHVRHNPEEDTQQVVDYLNKTYLEPRYNLRLKVIMTANAEYNDRMTLAMTGNEDWDLCYTASFVNKYWDRVSMGAFYDLNELMDTKEWAELTAAMPEGLIDWAMVDGHYYGIPNLQIMSSPNAIYLQKSLVDKYNLNLKDDDYILNINENEALMNWLKQVRDNEEDYIPLYFASQITNAIGYQSGDKKIGTYGYASYYRDTTDFTTFYLEDNAELKEKNIQKWLKWLEFKEEGFFADDFLTNADQSANLKANRYAVYTTTGKPGGGPDMSARQGVEYIQVYLDNYEYYQGSPMTTCTAINYNSKNPQAALKFIQVMWTDTDVYNTFLAGIEGEHYTKVSDNRIEPIADSGYNMVGWGWGCGNQFNQWLIPGQADDVWEQTIAMNENGMIDTTNGFTFDQTPVQTEMSNLSTVDSEWANWQWYCKDEAELRAKYDEYIQAKKDAGVMTVVEEVQNQLQAWAKANGKL